ncbi:type II toxin-antitoxin system VapC family toxin [Desertibaculum subflavum]|uniref:type II toxin-antitoxin system VapC family toxin n=1 Tax=Desertibaculum subflavum TaxID=2268458 RepID=UPI000E66865C
MSEHVLDASAVLALIHREPGEARVAELLGRSAISTVNLAEVHGKLTQRGVPEDVAWAAIQRLDLEIVPFDLAQARTVGGMLPSTRHLGLSLGDRACLALARQRGVPAVTTDRNWSRLDAGVTVEVIR